MVDFTDIGRRIKDHRKAKGLKQSDIAEMLNVSVSYISQIERGVEEVSLKRLDEIAIVVGATLDSLVSDVNADSENYLVSEIASKINPLPPNDRKRLVAVIDAYVDC